MSLYRRYLSCFHCISLIIILSQFGLVIHHVDSQIGRECQCLPMEQCANNREIQKELLKNIHLRIELKICPNENEACCFPQGQQPTTKQNTHNFNLEHQCGKQTKKHDASIPVSKRVPDLYY